MAQHLVSVSKLIQAPADEVYAVIANYVNGHNHILPRPPFGVLNVEQGGYGMVRW